MDSTSGTSLRGYNSTCTPRETGTDVVGVDGPVQGSQGLGSHDCPGRVQEWVGLVLRKVTESRDSVPQVYTSMVNGPRRNWHVPTSGTSPKTPDSLTVLVSSPRHVRSPLAMVPLKGRSSEGPRRHPSCTGWQCRRAENWSTHAAPVEPPTLPDSSLVGPEIGPDPLRTSGSRRGVRGTSLPLLHSRRASERTDLTSGKSR